MVCAAQAGFHIPMVSTTPPTDSTWTTRRRYFPALEGMRGVAALTVLVGHVLYFGRQAGFLHTVGAWAGPSGVVVFFLISGFLLYRPFIAARGGGRTAGS